jgi:thymidylate synthase
MKQYLDLMRHVRENGVYKSDRTGTGTYSVFGHQMRFDLSNGQFPLVTTKKCHLKSIIHELLWFLQGDTNIRYLKENGVSIWDDWSVKEAEFGGDLENRELVYVKPRMVPFSDYYNPDSTHSGDELNGKLKATWSNMLKRCYDKDTHNYRQYGGKGVFVCQRWHTYRFFVEDVQKLPNWKHKLNDWDNYNLDKDYYSSNCYSPDTCLWLSKTENSIYVNSSALIVISPNGHAEIYPSINTAAKELGIARNTLHRFGNRVPELLKGRNKVLKGWKFIIIDEPFRYDYKKVGDLGPVYGAQWRNWNSGKVSAKAVTNIVEEFEGNSGAMAIELTKLFKDKDNNGIDQITNVVEMLKKNPDSRRIIVSAWNPALVDEMALPPCHAMFQFYSAPLSIDERWELLKGQGGSAEKTYREYLEECTEMDDVRGPGIKEKDYNPLVLSDDHIFLSILGVPSRKLSCQLYQR